VVLRVRKAGSEKDRLETQAAPDLRSSAASKVAPSGLLTDRHWVNIVCLLVLEKGIPRKLGLVFEVLRKMI